MNLLVSAVTRLLAVSSGQLQTATVPRRPYEVPSLAPDSAVPPTTDVQSYSFQAVFSVSGTDSLVIAGCLACKNPLKVSPTRSNSEKKAT